MKYLEGILELLIIVIGTAVVIAFMYSILIAFPVMWLWNYLMPNLFALPVISFWQAFAMALLTSFLFKSSSSSK